MHTILWVIPAMIKILLFSVVAGFAIYFLSEYYDKKKEESWRGSYKNKSISKETAPTIELDVELIKDENGEQLSFDHLDASLKTTGFSPKENHALEVSNRLYEPPIINNASDFKSRVEEDDKITLLDVIELINLALSWFLQLIGVVLMFFAKILFLFAIIGFSLALLLLCLAPLSPFLLIGALFL